MGARIRSGFAILLIKIIQLIRFPAGIFTFLKLLHHTATQNAFWVREYFLYWPLRPFLRFILCSTRPSAHSAHSKQPPFLFETLPYTPIIYVQINFAKNMPTWCVRDKITPYGSSAWNERPPLDTPTLFFHGSPNARALRTVIVLHFRGCAAEIILKYTLRRV